MTKQRPSYTKQICDSLIAVLENCGQLDRLRLAGYAANVDFWLDEVQHRLQVIDGFAERRAQFVAATNAAYPNEIVATRLFVEPRPVLNDVHDSAKWRELQEDQVELRKAIVGKFARFLQRSFDFELIDQEKFYDLKHSLDEMK